MASPKDLAKDAKDSKAADAAQLEQAAEVVPTLSPLSSAPPSKNVHYANVIAERRKAQKTRVQIHGALAFLYADNVELAHWDCPAAVDAATRQANAETAGQAYFKNWCAVVATDIFKVIPGDEKVTVILNDATKYVI